MFPPDEIYATVLRPCFRPRVESKLVGRCTHPETLNMTVHWAAHSLASCVIIGTIGVRGDPDANGTPEKCLN